MLADLLHTQRCSTATLARSACNAQIQLLSTATHRRRGNRHRLQREIPYSDRPVLAAKRDLTKTALWLHPRDARELSDEVVVPFVLRLQRVARYVPNFQPAAVHRGVVLKR